jgi:hypothetical protein
MQTVLGWQRAHVDCLGVGCLDLVLEGADAHLAVLVRGKRLRSGRASPGRDNSTAVARSKLNVSNGLSWVASCLLFSGNIHTVVLQSHALAISLFPEQSVAAQAPARRKLIEKNDVTLLGQL